MKRFSTLGRLLAGTLLVCLASLAFVGCSDSSTVVSGGGTDVVKVSMSPVVAPAAGDTVAMTPPGGATVLQPVAAVIPSLAISSPTLALSLPAAGAAIVIERLTPAGAVQDVSNPLPITIVDGKISLTNVKLPAGSNIRIGLNAGTFITILQTSAFTRAGLPAGLTLTSFDMDVTVKGSAAGLSSTAPTDFDLNLTPSGSNFKLQGSSLAVKWATGVPTVKTPADGKASLKVTLGDGSIHTQTANINVATNPAVANFTGLSTAPFASVAVYFNAADAK